uniref:Uncharacterized protein n=1 Tax=Arundo donax TaxID=35708 RepID=A0A0A9A0Q9_ARUDO
MEMETEELTVGSAGPQAVRRRVELVDEREGVAGGLRHGHHPPPHGVLVVLAAGAIVGLGEGVEAGGGVGERGAGPDLHVAQAPREPRLPRAPHPLHLRHRLTQPLLRVAHQLRAVLNRAPRGGGAGASAAQVGGAVRRAVGAHDERGPRQAPRAAAHGGRTGEQGALADARVARGAAGAVHEVGRDARAHSRGGHGLGIPRRRGGQEEEAGEQQKVVTPPHLAFALESS